MKYVLALIVTLALTGAAPAQHAHGNKGPDRASNLKIYGIQVLASADRELNYKIRDALIDHCALRALRPSADPHAGNLRKTSTIHQTTIILPDGVISFPAWHTRRLPIKGCQTVPAKREPFLMIWSMMRRGNLASGMSRFARPS